MSKATGTRCNISNARALLGYPSHGHNADLRSADRPTSRRESRLRFMARQLRTQAMHTMTTKRPQFQKKKKKKLQESQDRNWDAASTLSKRFKIREAVVCRRVGARVFNLKRHANGSIQDLEARATDFPDQFSDEQMRELKRRLYTHLPVSEKHKDLDFDSHTQGKVMPRTAISKQRSP